VRQETLTEDGPLQVACLGGGYNSGTGAGAGNEGCAGTDSSASIYLTPELPDNPTHVREVGVETDKVKCDQLPTVPLTTCTSSPSSGGSR
jgi:hypothetical protein